MMNESGARREIVRLSRSLFDRGFSVGAAGNISCLVEDGILTTPTNSCLGLIPIVSPR
jgi:ribulose-5-phosphate 4-epimerase/fuculose-1-phosphate aldolase